MDYAAQKFGPDSEQATAAVKELDQLIGRFRSEVEAANTQSVHWLVASEYVISSVDHVSYPNRVLREAGLLAVDEREDGEHLDLATSRAWALVDHQFSHVFVKDRDAATIEAVRCQFADVEGIDRVLVGDERAAFGLDHDRSGDVVLISQPNSWQAYYWWQHDSKAPGFARTVDIHRKPGYDPVELFFDFATKSVPLDATLIKGSHGLVSNTNAAEQGVIMSSCAGAFDRNAVQDTDVGELVLRLMK